ncbi:hypothetical protein [Nostoc commune]|uniref:hypothetical protein n=1 Tax=Nostoc commune TaxID=1178 RepID=UPI0015E81BFA|nr:hypothetical protein [Nostoc commune]
MRFQISAIAFPELGTLLLESRKRIMPENANQPREYDAVLGGQAPPGSNAKK